MKNFKKIVAIVTVLCLVFSLTACGGGNAGGGDTSQGTDGEAQETYEFSATWVAGPTTPIIIAANMLVEELEEKSGGRIKGTIYHSGQITTSDRENLEKVQQNICQLTSVPLFSMSEFTGATEFNLMNIPYLFNNDAEMDHVCDIGMFDEFFDVFTDKTGVGVAGTFSVGWVALATSKGPVAKPSDITGLKIRSMQTDAHMNTLSSWKANPTPMSIGEVFTALQQGTVEGMLGASQMIYQDGYGEVIKGIVDVKPFATYHAAIYNKAWVEALPEDLQKVFLEALENYVAKTREISDQLEKEALDGLEKDYKVAVYRLSDEERAEWAAMTKPVYDTQAEAVGIDFVKAVEAELESFRK